MESKSRSNAGVLIFLFLVCFTLTGVSAAEFGFSPLAPGTQSTGDGPVQPLAPQSISQNTAVGILNASSVACSGGGLTTENAWYRVFDLDADHNLVGEFCVDDIDFGIETAIDNGVPQNLVVTTACLDDGAPFLESFLDVVGVENITQPDAELEFFNVNAAGCCDSENAIAGRAHRGDDRLHDGRLRDALSRQQRHRRFGTLLHSLRLLRGHGGRPTWPRSDSPIRTS